MKDYARYGITVLFLVLAVVVIVVGFNLIRNLFTSDSPAEKQTGTSQKIDLLGAPDNNKAVQYTVAGPVVAVEEQRSVRITVSRDNRTVEVLQGYENQVVKSQQLPNTYEAYDSFIKAINGAGFTNTLPAEGRGDEAQDCPLGRKFAYEIAPLTDSSFRSWSNTCGKKAAHLRVIQI